MRKRVLNEKGFTLVELMVVVIIIGILAAIAIPVVYKQIDQAKTKRAVAELKTMKTAIDIYRMEKGEYPKTDTIVDVLAESGISFNSMKDPWEKPYVYYTKNADPTEYVLACSGPDGTLDTAERNDNIIATGTDNPEEGATAVSLDNSKQSGDGSGTP